MPYALDMQAVLPSGPGDRSLPGAIHYRTQGGALAKLTTALFCSCKSQIAGTGRPAHVAGFPAIARPNKWDGLRALGAAGGGRRDVGADGQSGATGPAEPRTEKRRPIPDRTGADAVNGQPGECREPEIRPACGLFCRSSAEKQSALAANLTVAVDAVHCEPVSTTLQHRRHLQGPRRLLAARRQHH
jgi:hypothetical protein